MRLHRRLLASLLLTISGLGLTPSPVHAQASAAPAASPKNPPASGDTIRPEMLKLLDPASFKDLMAASDYAQIRGRIERAAAMPDPTPYESLVLNRLRVVLAAATGDGAAAIAALEAALASDRQSPGERADFIKALGSYHYNAKNYAQAIRWFSRYQDETGDLVKVRPYIIRAYYFSDDFASAKQALLTDLQADEQAGRQPPVDQLQLLANSGAKTGDADTYVLALERLVRFYPSDVYWGALLGRIEDGAAEPSVQLDVLRLERTVLRVMAPEKYLKMAQLALRAGFPAEASQAIEAGYAAGVLGAGPDAEQHKRLREQAAKATLADLVGMKRTRPAAGAQNDAALLKMGFAQVTMNQFDKGIELMEKGLARQGQAGLRLAYAYVLAGRMEHALRQLEALRAETGATGQLARYWMLWLKRPPVDAPTD